MRSYTQLSYEERVKLAQMRRSETSITKIASVMGRSRATIYRELQRNQAPPGEYWPDTAHQITLQRRKRGSILDRNRDLQDFVLEKLQCHYWTPEQIAGYLVHSRMKRNALIE